MPSGAWPGPPHRVAPRAGVFGAMWYWVTNLPSLVKTWIRFIPRSQTYTRLSTEMWMQCSAGAKSF